MLSSNKNGLINSKRKGFSLLEIVMSLGLIALFIIPLGNMVLGTVKINKSAEDKQQAGVLLQETVELIKQEQLPVNINEHILLSNAVKVERAEDTVVNGENKPTFNISTTGNKNGISLEGVIVESSVISSPNSIIKENVDGTVYFSGNNQGMITVADRKTTSDKFLEDIINGGNLLFSKSLSNSLDIEAQNNSNTILRINSQERKLSEFQNNSLLVILDNEKSKLELNITNKNQTQRYKIYLYNKLKDTDSGDILLTVHSPGSGNKNMGVELINITSSNGGNSNEIKMYSVNLIAVKNGKTLENITLDFVK